MTTLVLAPHADDEVLGMGGTIARLAQAGEEVFVAVLTGHGKTAHPLWPPSQWDVIREEARCANRLLGVKELIFRDLPAACLDTTPTWMINSVVAEVIAQVQPTELYVPFAHDLHRDHGAIAYAATVATRPYIAAVRQLRRVLAYETLSETHLAPPYIVPAFQPTVYVDISLSLQVKIDAMAAYASQLQPDPLPRSIQTIRTLAHWRGSHIGCAAAEAFLLLGEYQR
jgi:LmbE family N-acetylglucosaminyl deacetylase